MTIETSIDVVTRNLRNLLIQFRGKPRMEAFLSAHLEELQELEYAFADIRFNRALANATGVQLDRIGEKVGEKRAGLDDVTYRSRIRVRIAINRSNGKHAEILAILNSFAFDGEAAPGTIVIDEYPPASIVVELLDVPTPSVLEVARIVRLIKGAGIGARMLYVENDPAIEPLLEFGSVLDPPDETENVLCSELDDSFGGVLAGVVIV